MTDFAARLVDRGMTPDEANTKQRLFVRASEALGASGAGVARTFALFVPGRIEVLGKHTDYAGGRSLLCAAERGFCLVVRPRADDVVHVVDAATGMNVSVPLSNPAPASAEASAGKKAGAHCRQDVGSSFRRIAQQPSWAVYVSTVGGRLARNFPEARHGADIAFASDLPIAAGMSSSSALVTSVLLALAAVNDLAASDTWRTNIRSREDLAEYLGTVENGQDFRALTGDAGVGTFGGSEDHAAMLCCRAGELSQYSFCPVRHERQVPMPAGYVLTVAVSGVVAEKTGAARDLYNRASLASREVLSRWNRATGRQDPTLRAALDSADDAYERLFTLLPPDSGLRERLHQFDEETFVIIAQVGGLLAAGRVDAIGDLVDQSQRAAELGLWNQIPETTFLARSARELGAAAASAFGAGFGGSVWALVQRSAADDFCARWSERYAAAFGDRTAAAQFFTTNAGPSAIEMEL